MAKIFFLFSFAGVGKDACRRQVKSMIGQTYQLCLIWRIFKHQQNNLGPGSYDLGSPDSTEKKTRKCQSGGWKRQLEMERWSSIPYFGCKDERIKEKELARKLGPGKYFKNLDESNKIKAASRKGLMDSQVPRFDSDPDKQGFPGPGYYGIPQDTRSNVDFGTVGLLSSTSKRMNNENQNVWVGPGTYELKGSIEELLRKKTGTKGPYDSFTLYRNKSVPTGHRSVLVANGLGPGEYGVTSAPSKNLPGKFSQLSREPKTPADNFPGPGHYNPKMVDDIASFHTKHPPFLSNTSRSRLITNSLLCGKTSGVGPGRYEIEDFTGKSTSGHESCFLSKSVFPEYKLLMK